MKQSPFVSWVFRSFVGGMSFLMMYGIVRASQYTMLEPSIVGQGAESTTNAADYLAAIYKYGIGVAGGLAVIVFAIGGVHYMFPGHEKKGTEFMQRAVQGVLIALGAYLLLNTINPHLLDMNISLPSAEVSAQKNVLYRLYNADGTPSGRVFSSQADCLKNATDGKTCKEEAADAVQAAAGTSTPLGAAAATQSQWLAPDGTYTSQKLTMESLRRDSYATKNIQVNKSPCTYPGELNCTDIVGFQSATESELYWIRSKVGGTIMLTGGTEIDSHVTTGYSHPAGYKFDLQLTDQLSTYITSNFQSCATRSDGATCYKNTATGAYYFREGNHWDVAVQ